MDGAALGSVDVAQKKALGSLYLGIPSETMQTLTTPGSPFYRFESETGFVTVAGGTNLHHNMKKHTDLFLVGLPLIDQNNAQVGAVGVSGSYNPADDKAVATNVANFFKVLLISRTTPSMLHHTSPLFTHNY